MFLSWGGAWLGAMRSWMQTAAFNGDRVCWGSEEFLQLKSQSVREMEALAARVAAATLEEFRANLVTDDQARALRAYSDRKNWRTATEEDVLSGNLMVFDPDMGKMHFAMKKPEHGWQVAEFEEEKWRDQFKEQEKE